jgi:superfamily II DNA or RNA helicase
MLTPQHLTHEQQAAITHLVEHDQTLLIAGLGFGKAIVGLTALTELIQLNVIKRALVIAPLRVATCTWADEIYKWSHLNSYDVAIACGLPKQREKAVQSSASIVVINFENAKTLIAQYGDEFDGLLIDEMTKLKTSGGTLFKLLRNWVPKLRWRCGMSATPVAEDLIDIYGQALLLDDGAALGTRKTRFMETYFYPTDYMRYNWIAKPDSVAQITQKLENLVFRADDQNYIDSLPLLTTETYAVPLSPEGEDVYRSMEKNDVWGTVIAPNAAVRASKLAQIAAGGLYFTVDEDNPDHENLDRLVWSSTNKIDAIVNYVSELDEPVIITYNYEFERVSLMAAFPNAPVLGGAGTATAQDITDFNAGLISVLIGHPKSMSMGLNLQGSCRLMIHMSPMWSADLYVQSIGRIHRRGQTQPCQRVLFYTPGTVDERVAQAIKNKALNEAAFMAAMR